MGLILANIEERIEMVRGYLFTVAALIFCVFYWMSTAARIEPVMYSEVILCRM